jgi:hypothetical protein
MGDLLQIVSRDLLVPLHDLYYLVRSAPYRYKVYEIEKRQPGKKRIIAQPAREVKRLQYWVTANILRRYPIHPAALAYRKGKSILNNARAHAKKRYLLKLDFKDFFHSIKANDFRNFIEGHDPKDLDNSDIESLTRILFWKMTREGDLVLSIGAPSSPMLSNILLYEFDRRVTEYCKRIRVTYTRYADDLTFSTNRKNLLGDVEGKIDEICSELPYPRLRLNREKRVHASKAASRRVTGLVLSNDGSVSLGHQRKRHLHAAVHHFKHGKLSPDETKALAGMLAFVHSVEPKFLGTLARKYGKTVMNRLLGANQPPTKGPT